MTIQSSPSNPHFDEAAILREAAQHSRHLGKVATDARNSAWKHDDAVRDVRNNNGGQQRREALIRLAALIASYGGAAPGCFNEAAILREAERHSRRLGHVEIEASAVWWKQVDATRDVRNASAPATRQEALVRLAALHASYRDAR